MKLTLKAFRGVREPFQIEFSKAHLTILYGENGSGKTTISDALEFVFNGSVGSLEEKSLDGKGRLASLVNAQSEKSDLAVLWEEDQQTSMKASITGIKPLLSGNSTSTLSTLSRRNVTKLIEETPAKRFSRIQDFVSIPSIETEEVSLKTFIKEQKENQATQVRLVAQSEETLDQLHEEFTADLSPKLDREQWIKATLATSEATLNESKDILSDLHSEIERLRNEFKPLESAYVNVQESEKTQQLEDQKLAQTVKENASDFSKAFSLLQSSQTFLAQNEVDDCPVCDTQLTHQDLKQKVDLKLSSLKSIQAQTDAAKKAETAHTAAKTSLSTLQKTYFDIITRLTTIYQAAEDSELWNVPALIPELTVVQSPQELTESWFQALKNNAQNLKPLSNFVASTHENVQQQANLQRDLRRVLKQRASTAKEHTAYELIITKAEIILDALKQTRINYANQTLQDITTDFADLYSTIHPDEDIENIQLFLNPRKNASAEFNGSFFGLENTSPVAYLSESHLDTLGLCLFLALQKRTDPKNTILFLDDAIASVDEAHMERLYKLILDQASHFKHVIISSHYQPLRFKFRWGILTRKQVNFIELGKWSLNHGIALAKGPNSEITLLRKYITEQQDPSTIAAKSGIILEQALDFLTGIYHCKMPRHPGAEQRWTLDNYKSGLQAAKKLLLVLRCDHLDSAGNVTSSHEIAPLLEPIFNLLQIRNALGCHYKTLAGEFNELSEATTLGNASLALVDALYDQDNELPTSCKDGISWANNKPITRRLYPLLTPQ
jgi:energy-coupling factor transporter ATP-binding protein EcfA2